MEKQTKASRCACASFMESKPRDLFASASIFPLKVPAAHLPRVVFSDGQATSFRLEKGAPIVSRRICLRCKKLLPAPVSPYPPLCKEHWPEIEESVTHFLERNGVPARSSDKNLAEFSSALDGLLYQCRHEAATAVTIRRIKALAWVMDSVLDPSRGAAVLSVLKGSLLAAVDSMSPPEDRKALSLVLTACLFVLWYHGISVTQENGPRVFMEVFGFCVASTSMTLAAYSLVFPAVANPAVAVTYGGFSLFPYRLHRQDSH